MADLEWLSFAEGWLKVLQQQENGWTHVVYRQVMLDGVRRTTLSTNAKLNRGLGQQHQRKGKLREVVSFSGPGKQTWFIPSAVVCTISGPSHDAWLTPPAMVYLTNGAPHEPWSTPPAVVQKWSTLRVVIYATMVQVWLPGSSSGSPQTLTLASLAPNMAPPCSSRPRDTMYWATICLDTLVIRHHTSWAIICMKTLVIRHHTSWDICLEPLYVWRQLS